MILVEEQTFHFDTTAEISAAVAEFGWSVEYLQLDAGPLRVDLYERELGSLMLVREIFGCPMLARGSSPRDLFNVVLAPKGGVRFSGHEIRPQCAGLMPPGCEIDAEGAPDLELLHISTSRDSLAARSRQLGVDLLSAEQVVTVCPGVDRVRMLRQAWQKGSEAIQKGEHERWEENQEDLLTLLVALFDTSVHEEGDPRQELEPSTGHALATRRFIDGQNLEEMDLSGMADVLGVSRHHLNRCFRGHYGLSIRAYLRLLRFHHAHELLRGQGRSRTVTDAAYDSGFRHLGRFSGEYRRIFGETPGETLGRSQEQTV